MNDRPLWKQYWKKKAQEEGLDEYVAQDKNAQSKKWHLEIKKEVLAHYSGAVMAQCVKCGFTDIRALSIDHIEGNGAEERKKHLRIGTSLYSWLKKNSYPQGYQTLCMNCQWIKRAENGEVNHNGRVRKPNG